VKLLTVILVAATMLSAAAGPAEQAAPKPAQQAPAAQPAPPPADIPAGAVQVEDPCAHTRVNQGNTGRTATSYSRSSRAQAG